MKRLRRVRDLMTGQMDSALTEALIGQLEATKEGAWLAIAMIGGDTRRADAHEEMREIEHRGDTQRARLVEELSGSLITPIDREDIFRLSRSIDDILDSLRDFVRESHLYRVSEQHRFAPMLDQVIIGIEALETAVHDLASGPSVVAHDALQIKKAGSTLQRMYQYEIARIFSGEITSESMKERELVRRLEIVGTAISEAADAIADGAMKR
ncbi:phosphate transport regulator [Planobispora siamensis]|uniref:Phosphate transport regulator n=2 Tax=Planobispora siamensis TaxID=936338 RepID=A0A8J3SJG2_9ACTN|nr:phosphate transport regulator [Planobispora siamensis]